ncbi:MAG: DUF4124 domain-containing protein [Chromatiaceae bacterium]|nr:DUF4124 domain-containing protein [Gammaproteobacteria bacterium]MCP5300567.1 DUF4124 domain-containing protein [Chromatiaceae bacterium]MCP5422639.1 DUF4124 domain-containing protein [Chromatiaceae bacterium]
MARLLCLLLGLLAFDAGAAQLLFRWVDADGQLHVSDRPPPGSPDVERFPLPQYVEPDSASANYSIANQLDRMQRLRREREQAEHERRLRERELALQRRELELRERAAAAPEPSPAPTYVVPVRPRGHYDANRWRGYRPPNLGLWKQDHPAYRP